ncbi:MAG TPA: MFS transporter [Candidatus Ligilactobacillus faecavium]|nr:MFS transporter [Candidatus Ligilactobacillus faecavium]
MKQLYLKDKPFRILVNSSVLNSIGDYLFTIIFVIYAAHIPDYFNLATSIASINIVLPSIFSIFLGELANRNTKQVRTLITNKIWQICCFAAITALLCIQKNMVIFIVICILNLISEVIGNYSYLIELKLFKENVSKENMNVAMSMSQGLTSIVNIISQSYGAILIGILDYQYFYIGIINIITFFIALLILIMGRKSIVEKNKEENIFSIQKIFQNSIVTLKELKQSKNILRFVIVISLINMLIGSISSIQNIYFLNHKTMRIGSYGITLAVVNAAFTLGMLLGTMTPNDLFKKVSLLRLITLLLPFFIGTVLLYSLNISKLRYLLLITIFITTYFAGKISPRFASLIINTVPEDKVSPVSGMVNTIVTISIPVGTGILLFLYNTKCQLNLAWSLMIVVAVILLALMVKMRLGKN